MTRQEAIALVREVSNYMATRPEIDEAIDMAIEALQREPIVHCKDCKYWEKWENGQAVCRRSENGYFRFGVDADDYCSFAERKEQ